MGIVSEPQALGFVSHEGCSGAFAWSVGRAEIGHHLFPVSMNVPDLMYAPQKETQGVPKSDYSQVKAHRIARPQSCIPFPTPKHRSIKWDFFFFRVNTE